MKRKVASLHRKKMTTGGALMPANVRRAKHMRYMMTDRGDMGDAEEADTIANASFGDSFGENMASYDTDTTNSGSEKEDLIRSSMTSD